MADERLRELERRWHTTRTVEDAAALLRERMRVGELTRERCELASLCGDPGARALLGRSEWRGTVKEFVEQLARLGGHEALLRSLVALAQLLARALPVSERGEAQYVVLSLRAVEAWITNPSPRRRKAVLKARRECVPPLEVAEPGRGHVGRLERVMFRTVEALLAGSEVDQVTHTREGLGTVCDLETRAAMPAGSVMAALQSEVAPWALGLADPLPARRDALI